MRRPIQFLGDVAVLSSAFLLACLPAINFRIGEDYFERAVTQLPFVIFVQFTSLFLVGAYSILWRYISLEDLKVLRSKI